MAFTRKQRLGVYAFAGTVALALVFYGVIEAEFVPILLGIVWAGSNLLALFNMTPDDDPTDDEIAGPPNGGQ